MVVNSWPSPVGDGSTDVSIEYEIDSTGSTLEDLVITIPMPMYFPIQMMLMTDLDPFLLSKRLMVIIKLLQRDSNGDLPSMRLRMVDWSLIFLETMQKDSSRLKFDIRLQRLFVPLMYDPRLGFC